MTPRAPQNVSSGRIKVLRHLLHDRVQRQRQKTAQRATWHGHRICFVDGSSCSMADTPELQRRFGQPTEQKPGCGFPSAHLLAMFDAYTGMLVDVLLSSWRMHDVTRVSELHPHLHTGDVLVGDRAFGTYAHLALL